MPLSKKATILFPPELYQELTQQARQLGVSLGELVRRACDAYRDRWSTDERLEAVRQLEALALPVGEPEQMKQESVPDPADLLA
jgi:hypothetical protein